DVIHVLLHHRSGALSSIVASHAIWRYRRTGLELYGAEGTANLLGDDWDPTGFEIWRVATGSWEQYESADPTWHWSDGLRDLRVETLPVPEPSATELLVRVEACGVCPTDVRKFLIGTDESAYPLNPGHEWVGRVVEVGGDVRDWQAGDRVYGDTYAGYAEYA